MLSAIIGGTAIGILVASILTLNVSLLLEMPFSLIVK